MDEDFGVSFHEFREAAYETAHSLGFVEPSLRAMSPAATHWQYLTDALGGSRPAINAVMQAIREGEKLAAGDSEEAPKANLADLDTVLRNATRYARAHERFVDLLPALVGRFGAWVKTEAEVARIVLRDGRPVVYKAIQSRTTRERLDVYGHVYGMPGIPREMAMPSPGGQTDEGCRWVDLLADHAASSLQDVLTKDGFEHLRKGTDRDVSG